ncbi:hypothetical protein V6259_06185 [Marinomonas sp. TI.3.20]|uniref:hypothetical protein n=1 Tax=Marinomonas sp. TI.3.20 TaxID=3121296 RepID=UPI00311FFC67
MLEKMTQDEIYVWVIEMMKKQNGKAFSVSESATDFQLYEKAEEFGLIRINRRSIGDFPVHFTSDALDILPEL